MQYHLICGGLLSADSDTFVEIAGWIDKELNLIIQNKTKLWILNIL